jgi:hypothetical protein
VVKQPGRESESEYSAEILRMRETELILAQMSSRSGQGKDTLEFDSFAHERQLWFKPKNNKDELHDDVPCFYTQNSSESL